MKTYATAVGIPKLKDRVLILKRNSERSSSPNKWQFVSGYIKEEEPAEEAVLREVEEETGLEGKILKAGNSLEVEDRWGRWIITPYLISVESEEVEIDQNEHTECRWIKPDRINDFNCIAGIHKRLKAVGI